jgi:hypothetical protein
MKTIILSLLLAVGADAAAPVISSITADFKDYSTSRITVRVAAQIASPDWYVSWGYAHNSQPVDTFHYVGACRWVDTDDSGLGDTTECTMQILSTEPGRKIYVRVRLFDGAAEATSGCGGSITLSGLTCDSGENYPYYTSSSIPGPPEVSYPNGTYPKQPTTPSYNPPVITGVETTNQFTVANDCSDIVPKLASAVSAAATKDVQVLLNPGVANACPVIVPPAYNGSFKILIRSSAADTNLPAPGAYPEPRHYPFMAYINTTTEGAALGLSAGHNHYYFFGIYFTQKNLYPTAAISAITISSTEQGTLGASTWKFNLAAPLPSSVAAGSTIAIDGVTAYNSACGPGMMVINSVSSSTSFQLYCDGASVIPAGVDSTAGRFIVPAGSQRLASVTPGACAGGNARVRLDTGSRWGLATNDVIHIADTVGLTGLNNRGWRVTTVSGTDACLQSSTGVTGTHVANSGIYAVDATTTQLIVNGDTTDIWFDRCVVDGNPFPNRTATAINMTNCSSCGVVDSRIVNLGGWLAVDPSTGSYRVYGVPHALMTGIAVEMTYAQNLLVRGNYIEGNGIFFFAQANNADLNLPIAANVTIRQNEVHGQLSKMASGATSDGLYWPHRHWTEFKSVDSALIEGNYFDNNWSDDLTAGPGINLSTRQQIRPGSAYVNGITKPGLMRDITVRSNYFKDSSAILLSQYDSDSNRSGTSPSVRIAFQNNIIDNLDYYTYRSDPTTGGAGKNSSATGGAAVHISHTHGFIMDHNTLVREAGPAPTFLEISGFTHLWQHLRYTNNVYQDNRTPNTSGVQIGGFQSSWQGNMRDTFAAGIPAAVYSYPSGTFAVDPYSYWAGNLIVPGTQNNDQYATWDTSCYVSTSAACNITAAERDSFWGTGKATNIDTNSGYAFSGTSPDARLAEVKFGDYTRGNFRVHTASPASANRRTSTDGKDIGADLDQIRIARRLITGLRARLVRTTTATISFTAPVAGDTCYITYGSTRVSDNSSSRIRNVALTGLSSGTVYTAYATCGSKEQDLSFRTQ